MTNELLHYIEQPAERPGPIIGCKMLMEQAATLLREFKAQPASEFPRHRVKVHTPTRIIHFEMSQAPT
jgi:hypothetical protein